MIKIKIFQIFSLQKFNFPILSFNPKIIGVIIPVVQFAKQPYTCGSRSQVPFWPDKFFLNETCELSIKKLNFYGKYNQLQWKTLQDHGAGKTENFSKSDVAFERKFDFKSPEVLNYEGKFQFIPGYKRIADKDITAKLLK